MNASSIDKSQDVVTLINVFTVSPQQQQELIDVLVGATEEVIRHRPGFVSANIHASLDGTRVANYAQWRTQEDLQAMLTDPACREHLDVASALGSAAPGLYQVVSVHHA